MRAIATAIGVSGVLLFSGPARAAVKKTQDYLSCTSGTNGTTSNPWNGCAIEAAISAAAPGDLVLINTGEYLVNSNIEFPTTSGITLRGESLGSVVTFNDGYLRFGSIDPPATAISDIKIMNLTIDATHAYDWYQMLHTAIDVINCENCLFAGNVVLGSSDTSSPAVLYSGGGAHDDLSPPTKIGGNYFTSTAAGGCQLQLNPGPGTNSGFDVWGNTFDSVCLTEIGLSYINIHGNVFGNAALNNYTGIGFVAPYGSTAVASHVTIQDNVIELWGNNGAVIHGIPQGGGGGGTINYLTIDHNIVDGTVANISIEGGDYTDVAKTHHVRVTDNFLRARSAPSAIELTGGTYGLVDDVTVSGNILMSPLATDGTGQNAITTDSNTTNIHGNLTTDNINL